MLADLLPALQAFDADPGIGAIVLTGSEKAFAAGADIKEMQARTYADVYLADFIRRLGGFRGACASRSSRRSRAMRWAAAANWP